jgi:hypothetical protein
VSWGTLWVGSQRQLDLGPPYELWNPMDGLVGGRVWSILYYAIRFILLSQFV